MTITEPRLKDLLAALKKVRVGVIGDYCLDAYWELDDGVPQCSIETGKPTRAVRNQRYSLGGAGNIVQNLAGLGVEHIHTFGLIREDLFGRVVLDQLKNLHVHAEGLVPQNEHWDTPVYAKPFQLDREQSRIDFGRFNEILPASEDRLASILTSTITSLDALIVNQQLQNSICTETIIGRLNILAAENPHIPFILDARSRGNLARHMICKSNIVEAAAAAGTTVRDNDRVDETRLVQHAARIYEKTQKPVYITRGAEGISYFDGVRLESIPAPSLVGPIDTVGAGDTVVSALTATLAVGATLIEAGEFAVLAAAVTVQKLKQTGSATPEELLYCYRKYSA